FSSRMNGLVYQPLYREQHWLYCSDRHPLFDGRRIPADLITQQRMVSRAQARLICVRNWSRKAWISGSRERPRRRIRENGAW
ncbi:LysR substrate-binding domain-containing protein, partial [Pseudomonas aeruginosa]